MQSFLKSSIIVALGTLISRVSGLGRELLLAWFFGASSLADALNVAFKLPNLFRRIFAEGALSVAFIPIFSSFENKQARQNFANQTFIWLMFILTIFVLICEYFMPEIIILTAPGLLITKDIFVLTISLCRITIIYLFFVSICALIGGILNSLNKFAAFAFNQVILNLTIIIVTYGMHYFGLGDVIYAFCISLIIGGIAQVIFMYKIMRNQDIRFYYPLTLKSPELKTLMIRIIPSIGSAGIMQINLFISQILASFIVGAISILNYAERLYQFPLSILGVTFSSVLLPELSRLNKENLVEQSYYIQNKVIETSLLLSLPCAIGIMIFAPEFINLVYERGAFDSYTSYKVASVLFLFALGLPAFILVKIFSAILYAKGQTSEAFKITLYAMIINILLNITLMKPLGQNGIALGSSIAAWMHVVILFNHTKKYNYYRYNINLEYWWKILLLNITMATLLLLIREYLVLYYYHFNSLKKVLSVLSIITLSIASYFILATKLKLYDLEILRILKRRK